MKLDAYLKLHKQTYRQFAGILGENASQVHRWASGKRTPSLTVAARIWEVTNGLVSPMDFLPDAERMVVVRGARHAAVAPSDASGG